MICCTVWSLLVGSLGLAVIKSRAWEPGRLQANLILTLATKSESSNLAACSGGGLQGPAGLAWVRVLRAKPDPLQGAAPGMPPPSLAANFSTQAQCCLRKPGVQCTSSPLGHCRTRDELRSRWLRATITVPVTVLRSQRPQIHCLSNPAPKLIQNVNLVPKEQKESSGLIPRAL